MLHVKGGAGDAVEAVVDEPVVEEKAAAANRDGVWNSNSRRERVNIQKRMTKRN
jgi:hypothetical protein